MSSLEPDELYTLRAQFWLGHYALAIEEAKSVMRRPMSTELKLEREEFQLRSLIGLQQYDKALQFVASSTNAPSIQALGLRAQFEMAVGNDVAQADIISQLQSLLAETNGGDASVQLTAAHVFLQCGNDRIKEALQCVYMGVSMEHISTALQIYLRIDRLDLAKQQHQLLKQADEDAILTQWASVHIHLASGSDTAPDALHTLTQMSEQYGPSLVLLNAMACAYLQQGMYEEAEKKLEEAKSEGWMDADLLVNLIVCYQYQQKPVENLVDMLQDQYPTHFLAMGLQTVQGAFERESIKYQVAA